MHNNQCSPLTDTELKEAFSFYAEIFNSVDAKKKFSAASTMLFQLDKYLKNKIEGLDTFPILAVLEEYAHIQNGRQAKFIKPDNNEYKQTARMVWQTCPAKAALPPRAARPYALFAAEPPDCWVLSCITS